ncbi:hypothetical protein D3C80_1241040 [compost metagenome]
MRAIIDDERGDAGAFRPLHQNRQAKLESGVGKTAIGADFHDRSAIVFGHLRHSIGLNLACLDGAQGAFDAVDAVRFAGVTLTGNNNPRKRSRLHGIEPRLAENRFDPLKKPVDGQCGVVAHHNPPILGPHILNT